MQQPQIIEKPALTVVGLEMAFIHVLSKDATNSQVIGPLWDQFVPRAAEVPCRVGQVMLGVIYGQPESERTHPDELRYLAAVSVNSVGKLPAGMIARTVPAGKFAVFTHRGAITEIAATCHHIYRVWLPQSAWQHAGITDVELYDERFDCQNEKSEMEYWISVVPRK